ncbi:hypothetical protein CDAR_622981 [Caerostris darwini]|uniref:Uncharacterized protein n=1 Tax=Caerostris darwini TaxID=1538125 RepID=A0AAV4PET0_9ARAC|nr:hypothetical protein CDAR_622981 [Caerostris darwini]
MEITALIVRHQLQQWVRSELPTDEAIPFATIRWAHQIGRQSAMDLLQGQTLLLLLLTTAVATSAYTVRIGESRVPPLSTHLYSMEIRLWTF